MLRVAAFPIAVALLISACGSDFRSATAPRQEAQSGLAVPDAAPAPAPAPPPAVEPTSRVSAAQAALVLQDPSGMIIRTGAARIEVDSLETAIAGAQALAARLGGHVANVSMNLGEEQVRSATLELKIPSAQFDEALSGLRPLGNVEGVDVTAQDVGEEYVDVAARVANARRLEERLIRLLETRTGRLEDVLAVERELARVREEIERLDGRMRFLRSRVAMSTLAVTVHESAPLVSPPGRNILIDSFAQAWRNFVQFLAAFISALGFLLPLAALILGLAWAGRRAYGRVRGRRALAPAQG